MKDKKIIDMHVHLANYHIYPEYWQKGVMQGMYNMLKGKDNADEIVKAMIKSSMNDFDCNKLIRSMDEAGIQKSIIVMADFQYQRDPCDLTFEELYDEHRKNIAGKEDRLIVFAGCDPRRGVDGLKVFERGIKEYNMKGLKLYPPCGFELDDRNLEAFYEFCDGHVLPILIHMGPSLKEMKSEFNTKKALSAMLKKYKKAPFILGHGAIQRYEECYEFAKEYPNVYLELSGFQSYMKTPELVEERLQSCYEHCRSKVLFGTDWPMFHSQKEAVDHLMGLKNISDDFKRMILHENAERILLK